MRYLCEIIQQDQTIQKLHFATLAEIYVHLYSLKDNPELPVTIKKSPDSGQMITVYIGTVGEFLSR